MFSLSIVLVHFFIEIIMVDIQQIHLADQLSAAIQETFKERGYNVKVGIAKEDGDAYGFEMLPIDCQLDEAIVDSVVTESLTKIGVNWRG